MHSARGAKDSKGLYVGRFSCWCGPCKRKDWETCTTRTQLGIWDEAKQSYCNDWLYRPLVPKQPTAQERAASAEEYASGLSEGVWVAIDCCGGDDDHSWWLANAQGKVHKATADVQAAGGSMNIKEGYPVTNITTTRGTTRPTPTCSSPRGWRTPCTPSP